MLVPVYPDLPQGQLRRENHREQVAGKFVMWNSWSAVAEASQVENGFRASRTNTCPTALRVQAASAPSLDEAKSRPLGCYRS